MKRLRTFLGFMLVCVFAPSILTHPDVWERFAFDKVQRKEKT